MSNFEHNPIRNTMRNNQPSGFKPRQSSTCPKCGLYYNPLIEGSIPVNGCKCKMRDRDVKEIDLNSLLDYMWQASPHNKERIRKEVAEKIGQRMAESQAFRDKIYESASNMKSRIIQGEKKTTDL